LIVDADVGPFAERLDWINIINRTDKIGCRIIKTAIRVVFRFV